MKRALILNRRDTVNPAGGGAEIYTIEVAKGLVADGFEVTIFTSAFEGGAPDEMVEGVRHIRRGNELTVHFHGFLYALRNRNNYEIIIYEYNGIGFFTFLVPHKRRVMLIYQMYREFWFREMGQVAGLIPYFVEPILIKRYRHIPVITISDSTVQDLEGLGFRDVKVVMVGMNVKPREELPVRDERPTLLFLSRLRSTKRPEDAILIYRIVKKQIPELCRGVVGRGPEEEKLRAMAGDDPDIVVHGFVDEDQKFELMGRAHVLVVPGVREGFGINVIEAASQGTPSVGYDVHGLRDSIRNGRTGLLASGHEEAAQKALSLLEDETLYNTYANNCLEYAHEFDWSRRASEFVSIVNRILSS